MGFRADKTLCLLGPWEACTALNLCVFPVEIRRLSKRGVTTTGDDILVESSAGSFVCDVDGLVPVQKDCRAHERSVCAANQCSDLPGF